MAHPVMLTPRWHVFFRVKRLLPSAFYALLLSVIYGIFLCYFFDIKFSCNTSPSVKRGWYILLPVHDPLKRDQLVVAHPVLTAFWKMRHYFPSKSFVIKAVGGVPGDFLFTQQHTIYRCPSAHFLRGACQVLGRCLAHDRHHRTMPCFGWHGFKIPPHHYYLLGHHSRYSFDSRYFGLVNQRAITYRAHLLWSTEDE